ncbi:hypothetical protein P3T27_005933 [Kitasatospora sp. MAA19]|uniref:hypothetical protein n=1 Tax=unclassified Kitasatospora TaxID=2633591 RepID=UPI00247338E0|nr:hypothetical protein [Kitasatospora sp. MAA19]MDH6709187.1 hypothetical protein [Kitasatospora sp. MAA19]
MAIPDLIPIQHEPDFRTETIGRFDGGLFFAWITGGFPPGYKHGPDWGDHKRWYAILHRFDHSGNYVDSDIWCPGPGPGHGVDERLAEWLDALPGREYCDIAIRPFQLTVDGILFGLVPECHGEYPDGEEEDDWAEFYPGGLGFSPPWDGLYDT